MWLLTFAITRQICPNCRLVSLPFLHYVFARRVFVPSKYYAFVAVVTFIHTLRSRFNVANCLQSDNLLIRALEPGPSFIVPSSYHCYEMYFSSKYNATCIRPTKSQVKTSVFDSNHARDATRRDATATTTRLCVCVSICHLLLFPQRRRLLGQEAHQTNGIELGCCGT